MISAIQQTLVEYDQQEKVRRAQWQATEQQGLWTKDRLQTYPLGIQLIKKSGGRRGGQQETWWGGQVRRVEPLPLHLVPLKEIVLKAYARVRVRRAQ